jgi:hypothetical protein
MIYNSAATSVVIIKEAPNDYYIGFSAVFCDENDNLLFPLS